jgi:SAM-dependent methyltransferase
MSDEPTVTDMRSLAAPRTCNICDSTEFEPGWNGRMYNGLMPQCAACKSLERHRAARTIYETLRPISKQWRVLHFAPDQSVDPAQFATYRPSRFGHPTSLDMMATGLPDDFFDVVISNHVLEHVPDFLAALRETLRLVGMAGFVHVMVPPHTWDLNDWAFPDKSKTNHYRDFGADFAISVQREINGVNAIGIAVADPVTGASDMIYLFSRSPATLINVHRVLLRKGVRIVRFF